MTYGTNQARLEQSIARLHRAVAHTRLCADICGQETLSDDLWLLQAYVMELGTSQVARRIRRVPPPTVLSSSRRYESQTDGDACPASQPPPQESSGAS